ncbi:hypothetical protein DCAR_0205553 [Daucus carota subsp. sativus]|uniref:Uncharacterized protein n=1 Tax=Daucus carota subsp. sativus TaxID=79200 RepID=A0A166CQ85_DAUCS|nr:hypothetical protein DCAR_0205553 [Daucus carota subsp. sativus]
MNIERYKCKGMSRIRCGLHRRNLPPAIFLCRRHTDHTLAFVALSFNVTASGSENNNEKRQDEEAPRRLWPRQSSDQRRVRREI